MAQEAFSAEVFSELLDRFAFAGELGIDGKSRVSLNVQRRTLQGALEVLRSKPRITSIHSHAANEEVLTMLANNPTPGVILHWWLGSRAQTERACELGCYFSVNTASLKDMDFLSLVPLDRVFAETDHPFGDRSDKDGRPGLVTNVETSIGEVHRISVPEVRLQLWRNLATLVGQTRGAALLPKQVRNRLASL
jgi:TatD DNase family protein